MAENTEQFDPRAAMSLLELEDRHARRSLAFRDNLIYVIWGLCYLIGYLPLALATTPGAPLDVPDGLALAIFGVAVAIGLVASTREQVRASRGIRGNSALRGLMYGTTWWAGFLGIFGLGAALSRTGSAGAEAGVVVNGAAMMLVATMFMAGGAIWLDVRQYVLGAWIGLVTIVALLIGLPAYYWLLSLATGGGLLLAPVLHPPIERWYRRRGSGQS